MIKLPLIKINKTKKDNNNYQKKIVNSSKIKMTMKKITIKFKIIRNKKEKKQINQKC